ncbi:MAG: hypothetical protein QOJ54_1730 [Aliidongia sp.]|jgi:putative SOS response-associated peptidase YedK|nr:hypothetical protein [Aliidongia sp.]
MCGRARLSSDYSELKIMFRIPDDRPAPNFAPNWNAAPTQSLPIVRVDPGDGRRSLDLARWGMIPPWWDKPAKEFRMSTINAMSETVAEKPLYKSAFKSRRCLVPFDSFYEWKVLGPKEKQPYAIALADKRPMAMAGLWANWKSPDGEQVRSFTIMTTEPNELMATIHTRMPVILAEAAWPGWLGEVPAAEDELKALLVPLPAAQMVAWPVSRDVGNVRNNRPDLVEPIEHRP